MYCACLWLVTLPIWSVLPENKDTKGEKLVLIAFT